MDSWGTLQYRGSNFTSGLLQEFYCLFGIKSIRTSAYHPQTDGMVERLNSTIKHMLLKLIGQFDRQVLSHVLFASVRISSGNPTLENSASATSTLVVVLRGNVSGYLETVNLCSSCPTMSIAMVHA